MLNGCELSFRKGVAHKITEENTYMQSSFARVMNILRSSAGVWKLVTDKFMLCQNIHCHSCLIVFESIFFLAHAIRKLFNSAQGT